LIEHEVLAVALQEVMDRCIANYRKTTGIELRMAIDPDNFLSSELYVLFTGLHVLGDIQNKKPSCC